MATFFEKLRNFKDSLLASNTQLIELCSRRESMQGYKDVTKTVTFNKPTLLLFSTAMDAKGGWAEATKLSEFLGHRNIFSTPYQLITACYPGVARDMMASMADLTADINSGEKLLESQATSFNTNGDLSGQRNNFKAIVQKKLLPLVSDKAERLSLEEAKRRCSNLVLASFSFGSVAAEVTGNLLVEQMEKLGYWPNEINEITSQIVHVSIGNVASLDHGKANFTGYHFINELDKRVEQYSPSNLPFTKEVVKRREKNDSHLPMGHVPGRPGQIIIMTPSIRTADEGLKVPAVANRRARFDGGFADKNGRVEKPYENHTAHHYSDYIEYRLRGFGFMQTLMVQNILINAISRSIRSHRNGYEAVPSTEAIMSVPSVRTPAAEERKNKDFGMISGEIQQWNEACDGMYANAQGVGEATDFQKRLKASLSKMQGPQKS